MEVEGDISTQAVTLFGGWQRRLGFLQPGAPVGNEEAPKVALTCREGRIPIGHSVRVRSDGRSLAGRLCRGTEKQALTFVGGRGSGRMQTPQREFADAEEGARWQQCSLDLAEVRVSRRYVGVVGSSSVY